MWQEILQWALPSGSLGALLAWIFSRNVQKAQNASAAQDAYKTMYERLYNTVLGLQNENIQLQKAVRSLNRTIRKATDCRHYGSECPVFSQLRSEQDTDTDPPDGRG